MKSVSIVTPIYKGRQYIPHLTQMIRDCAIKASEIAKVEWVIVNDYPEDNITNVDTGELFGVQVLPTDRNRGIQGARVRGLLVSTGEYVTFWDQDDIFPENWIESQIKAIGDADAVVCDQYREGKTYYGWGGRPELEEAISIDYLLNECNGFLPGQVLIKKNSIPKLWIERQLTWNCADDYYLWLSMHANGCEFVSNKDTCFDHVIHRHNQSLNVYVSYMSTKEMMGIFKEEKLFSSEIISVLEDTQERIAVHHLKEIYALNQKMNAFRHLTEVYDGSGSYDIDRVKEYNGSIGVYGADTGLFVYRRLKMDGVEVSCIIDREAARLELPIPGVTRENIPRSVKCIISTVFEESGEVLSYIRDHYPDIEVIEVGELFE